MNLSGEIRRLCGIVGSAEEAPKFDYDSSDLTAQERDLLAQLAKCMTEGALRGKGVQLVGRADPRGEQEYNMQLGERRADAVERYVRSLGVEKGRVQVTSRGELDATGSDEEGWREDRRVDITLSK
jgi:peptidoglycan-associated lipoprotein